MKKLIIFPLAGFMALLLFANRFFEAPEIEEIPETPVLQLDSTTLDFIHQYELYIRRAIANEKLPGAALAIVKDSLVIFQKGFGVKDVTTREAVDEHTVFRLASVSKGFAPILTGILVEKGILNWADKVTKHLPDFRLNDSKNTRDFNLEHILSHTTGLPRHTYSNLLNMGVDYPTIRNKLAGIKLAHPVGTHYNYQNVAYSLIGEVAEQATETPYNELMANHIYDPLGMLDASTTFEAIEADSNVAYPHRLQGERYKKLEIKQNYYEVAPAAGVNASISDMAQWLQLLLGNHPDIIADSTLNKIFEPYIWVSTREKALRSWRPLDKSFYALGWRVMKYNNRTIIYHGGYVNGYRAEIAFDREAKIGAVLLCHSPAWFISQSMPRFFDLFDSIYEP